MQSATIHSANGCLLLQFPARPPSRTLQALKAAGFRWDDYVTGWYVTDSPAARAIADQYAATIQGGAPNFPAPAGVKESLTPAPTVKHSLTVPARVPG